MANGDIPFGLCVLHRCDNRRCCNPAHLFLGTNGENVFDKVAKGRQAKGRGHGALGERSGTAKVSQDEVREIRRAYAAGEASQYALADRFGISQGSVSLIVRRINWWWLD